MASFATDLLFICFVIGLQLATALPNCKRNVLKENKNLTPETNGCSLKYVNGIETVQLDFSDRKNITCSPKTNGNTSSIVLLISYSPSDESSITKFLTYALPVGAGHEIWINLHCTAKNSIAYAKDVYGIPESSPITYIGCEAHEASVEELKEITWRNFNIQVREWTHELAEQS